MQTAHAINNDAKLLTRKELAFDVLFNQRRCLFFMLDTELNIEHMNPYCANFLGVDLAPIYGKYLPSWFASIELVSPIQSNEKEISQRRVTRSTLMMAADSKLYRVHWEWIPLKNQQNEAEGYLLIGDARSFLYSKKPNKQKSSLHAQVRHQIDVTTTDHLQQCAQHYDQCHIAMAWKNRSGQYIGINETFLKLFGCDDIREHKDATFVTDAMLGLKEEQCAKLAKLDEALFNQSLPSSLSHINYEAGEQAKSLTIQAWPYNDKNHEPVCLMYLITNEDNMVLPTHPQQNKAIVNDFSKSDAFEAIEKALLTTLVNLSDLAKQSLNSANQDPLMLRSALETMLIHINQFKTLLSLPQPDVVEARAMQATDVESLIQQVVYSCANNLLLTQIGLSMESITKQDSPILFAWSQEVIQNILTALITPCMELIYKGHVVFKCNPRKTHQGKQVFALQMSCTGVDAENNSIQQVLIDKDLEDPLSVMSKTRAPVSYLQWVMAHRLFDSMSGLGNIHFESTDTVVFTFYLPCMDSAPKTENNNESQQSTPTKINSSPLLEKNNVDADPTVQKPKSFESAIKAAATRLLKKVDKSTKAKQQRDKDTIAILLVEDNFLNQRVMFTMFEKLPCTMDVAPTAKDAREQFLQKDYDLVLLDIGLPDSEGLNLARILRSLEHKHAKSRTHICVVSAHPHLDHLEGAVPKPGEQPLIQAFYTKPLQPQEATELVETLKKSKNKTIQ